MRKETKQGLEYAGILAAEVAKSISKALVSLAVINTRRLSEASQTHECAVCLCVGTMNLVLYSLQGAFIWRSQLFSAELTAR